MKPVNVGICGLGTVGSGTFNVLSRNQKTITAHIGRPVHISHIGARSNPHQCTIQGITLSRDIFAVARDPEIDILVETIGGCDTAKELILTAINNGKHVVTANKALIAEHGAELFAAAQANNVMVAYEAAVGGGIPIIKCLREGLAGNRINWLAGIINGTGNYILSEMSDKGRPFADVLKEAQALGYAEADPTLDIEGIDACHKLTIMASIAFGIPLQFDKACIEGISTITPIDIQYAEELGYRIKHLALARKQDNGIELRVSPVLIPASQPIANINGVLNTIVVDANAVGQTMYTGAGAGAEPTASAVIADIIDIASALSCNRSPVFALGWAADMTPPSTRILAAAEFESSYYLRLQAEDHPGFMNAISHILSLHDININAVVQKPMQKDGNYADIVILTQQVSEVTINQAIQDIEQLSDIKKPVIRIRIESMS